MNVDIKNFDHFINPFLEILGNEIKGKTKDEAYNYIVELGLEPFKKTIMIEKQTLTKLKKEIKEILSLIIKDKNMVNFYLKKINSKKEKEIKNLLGFVWYSVVDYLLDNARILIFLDFLEKNNILKKVNG
jgi:hypothetical protein